MIKHKQLFRHNPPESFGDCQRTALACLLDKDVESVPHFGLHYNDAAEFNKQFDDYLKTQGLARVEVIYDCSLEDVLAAMGHINPNIHYMLSGQSTSGCNHVVIACGGRIVWDPSQNDSGIVGPCDDGFYWCTHLVPSFLKVAV